MPKTARILGTGSYLPPNIVTNEDLEKKVRNFDGGRAGASFSEWAMGVTGIAERRHADGESAEGMAAKASRLAMAAAGVEADEVDAVLLGTFTPDRAIPNAAVCLCNLLGIPAAVATPLNTACAGFVYALGFAYALVRADMARTVLVASAEKLSGVMDFDDPKTVVLFGDGAGAAVIRASDDGGICGPPYLNSQYSEYITLDAEHANGPDDILAHGGRCYALKRYLAMPGGPRVLKNAVDVMADALLKALERTPFGLQDLAYVIPHQANARITQGLTRKLGLVPEKVCDIIRTLGNCSGATVPIALDRALRGELEGYAPAPGDRIGLTALGGGYSIAAAVVEI